MYVLTTAYMHLDSWCLCWVAWWPTLFLCGLPCNTFKVYKEILVTVEGGELLALCHVHSIMGSLYPYNIHHIEQRQWVPSLMCVSTVMDTLKASWTISMATLKPAVQAVTCISVVNFNCLSMQACHCMWVSQKCMIPSGARASITSLGAVPCCHLCCCRLKLVMSLSQKWYSNSVICFAKLAVSCHSRADWPSTVFIPHCIASCFAACTHVLCTTTHLLLSCLGHWFIWQK